MRASGKQIINNLLSIKKHDKAVDITKVIPPPVIVGFLCILLKSGLSRKQSLENFIRKAWFQNFI